MYMNNIKGNISHVCNNKLPLKLDLGCYFVYLRVPSLVCIKHNKVTIMPIMMTTLPTHHCLILS